MPVHRLTTAQTSSEGAYQIRESSFNQHRFSCARDNPSRPYPTATEVFQRSGIHHTDDDPFNDLGLSDFFVTNRRVARHRLSHLRTTEYVSGLLSRGVQPQFDRREPHNEVLQASIGYAAACSVATLEEVSLVYERQDELRALCDMNRDGIEAGDQALRERIR